MKKTNKFKVFLIIILISVVTALNFTLSVNTDGNISLRENVEAMANIEDDIAEAEKLCTAAGGLCFAAGILVTGISVEIPKE